MAPTPHHHWDSRRCRRYFDAMPGAFVTEAGDDVNGVFQYVIAGAGKWYCKVKDGACKVVAGIHDNPTCILKMADTDFLKMINGQLPPMQAYTSGKLKIDGDIMKSQLIEKLFQFR
jgi:putative sterol carrier protein